MAEKFFAIFAIFAIDFLAIMAKMAKTFFSPFIIFFSKIDGENGDDPPPTNFENG